MTSPMQTKADAIADCVRTRGVATCDPDNLTLKSYVGQRLTAGTYTSYFDAELRRQVFIDHEHVRKQLALTDQETGEPVRCDTAIMHGPGHQSTSECAVEGPHTVHYDDAHRFEWTDEDVGTQTTVIKRYSRASGYRELVAKTYRLASTGFFE